MLNLIIIYTSQALHKKWCKINKNNSMLIRYGARFYYTLFIII